MQPLATNADSPIPLPEFIKFWAKQFEEHMLVLVLALADSPTSLPVPPVPSLTSLPEAKQLKAKALQLMQLWKTAQTTPVLMSNQLETLLTETIRLKERIQTLLATGAWIGFAPNYSTIEHMLNEALYVARKLAGEPFTLETEIPFWLWHDRSEIAYTSSLIDPKEKKLHTLALLYEAKVKRLEAQLGQFRAGTNIQSLPEVLAVLNEFNVTNTNLKQLVAEGRVLSNLFPELVDHALREGKLGLLIVKWVLSRGSR